MKPSTRRQAIKALRKMKKRIAFDANLYRDGLAANPHAEKAYKTYRACEDAIKDLREPEQMELLKECE